MKALFWPLRLLLPSWRFFEDVGYAPIIEYKTSSPQEDSTWIRLSSPYRLTILSFFYNPGHNYYLWLLSQTYSIIESVQNGETKENIENLREFKLLKNEIENNLKFQPHSFSKIHIRISSLENGKEFNQKKLNFESQWNSPC